MLSVLVIVQLALKRSGWTALTNTQCVPYIIFAFVGFAAAMIHGEVGPWYTVCLAPLLLMILTNSMVHTPDDAVRLIRAALIAILGYLIILWLASQVGTVISGGRVGDVNLTLGPIQFTSWAVTLATLIASGFPAVVVLLLQVNKSNLSRFFYGAVLVLFLALFMLTAARGATVAAVVGALVALVVVFRRLSSPGVVATTVLLFLAALIWGESLLNILPQPNLERLYTLRYGVSSIVNFQARMDILRLTVENTLRNPLGYGFSYLWARHRIDESILYSALLSGTGLMGFAGFVLIVGHLLWHFTRRILSAPAGAQRDLAAIGLGTLVCGLLTGVASESVMLGPVHSVVFWAILVAAYRGTRVPWRPASNPRPERQCESLSGSVP